MNPMIQQFFTDSSVFSGLTFSLSCMAQCLVDLCLVLVLTCLPVFIVGIFYFLDPLFTVFFFFWKFLMEVNADFNFEVGTSLSLYVCFNLFSSVFIFSLLVDVIMSSSFSVRASIIFKWSRFMSVKWFKNFLMGLYFFTVWASVIVCLST